MRLLITMCVLALAPAFGSVQNDANDANRVAASVALEAINKNCPIGKEAIDGETFITYDGHTIGFCCGGCDSKFLAWSQADKDAFVKASLAEGQDSGAEKGSETVEAMPVEPYTLTTCPVSGEALGAMGDAVIVSAEGRDVKLCCKMCVKKFDADPAKYLAIVDKAMIEQQRPYYMTTKCVVSGESLIEEGKDVGVDVLVANRLFRVCCKSCVKKVQKDPLRYRLILDKEIAAAQRPLYPLKNCIVRGEKGELGSMGEPRELVVGNRLVRFCCKSCIPKFEADPAKFIAELDKSWAPVLAERAKTVKEAHGEHGESEQKEGHEGGDGHK